MKLTICSECNKEIEKTALSCPSCGCLITNDEHQEIVHKKSDGISNDNNFSTFSTTNNNHSETLISLSAISFIVSFIFYYKGYDKLTNYSNPRSFSLESQNAYVSGDAYNYIINGTYSTSFFVLGVGFSLIGLLLVIIYYLSKSRKEA